MQLARGEMVGFVGPNGAGKSTFMKLLLGVCRPTRGRASVLGLDAQCDSVRIRGRVGYLPGDLGLYRNLSGRRCLEFCLSFYPRADLRRALELGERLDLPLHKRVKGYSTGMRQKLGLIQALAVDAELLLLDEPTKGLDPTTQATFFSLIGEELERGRSILLSSHVLDELERTCHRIVFIERGRRIDDATIEAARAHFRKELRVTFAEGETPDLVAIDGVAEATPESSYTRLRLDGPLGPVLARLAELGVDSIEYNRPSLGDVYRAVYLERDAGQTEEASR